MSSSEAFDPGSLSPWSLDELEVPDVFLPIHDMLPADLPARPADRTYDEAEFEAAVTARLAQLRPRLEADAYARGHAAGVQEAGAQSREQIARVLQALVDATASVQAHEQRWLGNVEENLAAAAVTVARHLIHRELTTEPAVITDLVARSLQQFPIEQHITVRLHPEDLAIVQDAMAANTLAAAHDVRWHADPHLVRGGCLVDGRERVLDGRIDTALERAYRALGQVQA